MLRRSEMGAALTLALPPRTDWAIQAAGVLFFAVTLAGCGDVPDTAKEGRTTEPSVDPLASLSNAPVLSWIFPTPLLELGLGEEPFEQFSRVVGAVRLSSGTVVVGDAGTSQLRYFSNSGDFLFTAGREGEGPGEFGEVTRLSAGRGDSVIVADELLQRLSVFGPEGSFGRSLAFPADDLSGGAVVHDLTGEWVAVSVEIGPVGAGLQRPPRSLFLISVTDGSAHSLGVIPGVQEWIEGSRRRAFLFGASTEVRVGESSVYVVSTDQPIVSELSFSGEIRNRFGWDAEPVPVTQRIVSDAMEERVASFPAGVSPRTVERLLNRRLDETVARQLPVARAISLDQVGNLWVERFPVPGQGAPPYLVFDPAGRLLGSVALPPGRKKGSSPMYDPALDLGADYLLGVWVNEMGVELVREYSIARD